MNQINQLFLEALNASLSGRQVCWNEALPDETWAALFKLARAHQVVPMIFDAVYSCPAAGKANPAMMRMFKQMTLQSAMLQTMKTRELLMLLKHLRHEGITPCLVKGIVCRNLYPKPELRISSDEDVLIPQEQFERCHKAMLDYGMVIPQDTQDILGSYEVPYGKPNNPIYIELHKSLFPPESRAYGDLNRFFADVHERVTHIAADGQDIPTLSSTDHFFYLICHAFKHFLHSGFGIRQVCDIVLFANRYGHEIDWMKVLEQCREIDAELFAAALLSIGRKHLGFDPDKACYPQEWRRIEIDEQAMLMDLLESGIYGDADMNRKHSSTITLGAVSDHKEGKRFRMHMLSSVFPPIDQMLGRYPYLKKKPYLLPYAWVVRILRYRKEHRLGLETDAVKSLKIGRERIELLRRYGIIR